MPDFQQLVMVVLDGFGVASAHAGNAVTEANPENINYLINHFPATTLQASGPSVGLPWGERGNSEVGHLNLGAGRIVSQDLPRISQAIASGEFYENPVFLQAAAHVKKNHSRLHLVGLVSPGGVHSQEEHVYALLVLFADQQVAEVYIHMFTDGRDTPPKAAILSLDKLYRKMIELGVGKIATLAGRFFAMDRGEHWELTERTYKALVLGQGEPRGVAFGDPTGQAGQKADLSARAVILNYYQRQIYDETIPPTVINEAGRIQEGDAVIFFNFRPDRTVQLARALTDPSFDKFSRQFLQNIYYASMTLYQEGLPVAVAFPRQRIKNSIAQVLSQHRLRQFHVAESEKYAHVTSFFNGGREQPWPGEEREIITSPAAYEKQYEDVPEMSADKIGQAVVAKIGEGVNFVLANFANPDMVGHTANLEACVKAVRTVDKNLGLIFQAVIKRKAALMITADHGNIEEIIEPRSGRIDKGHSMNPVPLILAGPGLERPRIKTRGYLELPPIVPEGVLSDVAPTALELLGLEKPPEMTAISLVPTLLGK